MIMSDDSEMYYMESIEVDVCINVFRCNLWGDQSNVSLMSVVSLQMQDIYRQKKKNH